MPPKRSNKKRKGDGKESKNNKRTKGRQSPGSAKGASKERKKKVAWSPNDPDYDYSTAIPPGVELLCLREDDDELHEAKVLENKVLDKSQPGTAHFHEVPNHKYIYYMHFKYFNRRMDEWVTRDRLIFKEEYHQMEVDEGVSSSSGVPPPLQSTNPLRQKRLSDIRVSSDAHEDHGDFDEESLKVHEEVTKVKNIETIVVGPFEMETWYFSPFPKEYNKFNRLYFCEYCLSFFGRFVELQLHMQHCEIRHPPGDEIYRSQEQNVSVSVWEVDGRKEPVYCQNLCYIAKLFLDHKTLQFDTDPFLFYIVTELDAKGHLLVGYFSKEKYSEDNYNVACILTLPCHQRKGYGRFLISLSYELSKLEKKAGSPEKPLSDLGAVSYRSYWSKKLLEILRETHKPISIKELSELTSFTNDDITDTLRELGCIRYVKGEHVLCIPEELEEPKQRKIDPTRKYVANCRAERLRWTPYKVKSKKKGY